MTYFLYQQMLFIGITLGLLFVPGWLFLSAFYTRNQFALLEKFILSIPISFSLITLAVIGIDRCGISLTPAHLVTLITSIIILLIITSFFRHKKSSQTYADVFTFSTTHTFAITLLIVMTIFIKTLFLINTVFPTATDLGHHLYWVEKIAATHTLPDYEKIDIDITSDPVSLSAPQSIADFIVGEHIFLGIIRIVTHLSVISTFPSLFLLLINIFTILLLFVFVRRVFEKHPYGTHIAIMTLFIIGPLWAISGAQAKFVSGGVIGNLIGNLLIPSIFYFFYRALNDKKSAMLISAILLAVTLAYTHHLSALIFGYAFIFSILVFAILQKNRWSGYLRALSLLKNYYVLPLLAGVIFMLFVIAPPAYLDQSVIADSVGAPSKSTRIGTPFADLLTATGEARFTFGVIGLLLLTVIACKKYIFSKKIRYDTMHVSVFGYAFLIGWATALLIMSLAPHILYVNIISSRIATYNIFPLAILAAFAIVWLFAKLHKPLGTAMPQKIVGVVFLLIFTFLCTTGMRDNATSMNPAPQTNSALQTFHVGAYASETFAKQIRNGDFWLLKDHNYITADTWLKIFFAHDYSFPLSRAFFARYESNPDRETCTLDMISTPDSATAQQCFDRLHVKAILVSTEQDAPQFLRNDQFFRIYQNDELSLFVRKK